MQIVIDIDENVFTRLFDNGTEDYEIVNDDLFAIAKSIRKGTPLPKGCDIQRIVPKKVDVQKWIYTKCPNPNCNYDLSTHHGDGYYSIEDAPSFCPKCGQALLWKSEE